MEPLSPGTRVLVADIRADYGQFKKYFTTMSPLTFPVPPPTAIRGMLAAICGIDRAEAPQRFASARLALSLHGPVRKATVPVNYLKTTSKQHFSHFEDHKPTIVEYVVDAAYRLYIAIPDAALHDDLKHRLERHHSVYTLSFGTSESLANYHYRGETRVTEVGEGSAKLTGLTPTDLIRQIDFTESELFTLTLPVAMNNAREVASYREFIFDRRGAPIQGEFKAFERLATEERLAFF